jgi:hypothetical protein
MLLPKMIWNNGIIDINFIPADAFEFCYDTKIRKKVGIMITNFSANMYNIACANGITNVSMRTYKCWSEIFQD